MIEAPIQSERGSDSNCGPANPALFDALAEDFQGTSTRGERYDKANAAGRASNRDCRLLLVRVRFFGDSLSARFGASKLKTANKCPRCRPNPAAGPFGSTGYPHGDRTVIEPGAESPRVLPAPGELRDGESAMRRH